MTLSEKNTTYSDLGNSGVESYAKLTVGGTDYSVHHIYEGRVGLFVLIDGKVYMGYARNNYLYYFTSDSGGYSVDMSGNVSAITASPLQQISLSPENSELQADLIDGGIDYE